MGIFDAFISGSQQAGVFSMYLPFILTFALIYGLLNKSKILGDGKPARVLNAIIGFSVAFYVIAFTSAGVTIATFFSSFLTQTTALIVTVISLVLVLTAIGPIWGEEGIKATKYGGYVALIVVAILLWSFSSSGGSTIFGISLPISGLGLSSQDIVILVFIGVTIGIIYFVTKGEKAGPSEGAPAGGAPPRH
ncbi:hypothetical protein EPN87_00585 [archaeon]|nr:MAG: hypothetical protein EPN87_00585 [archaeon]